MTASGSPDSQVFVRFFSHCQHSLLQTPYWQLRRVARLVEYIQNMQKLSVFLFTYLFS